MLFFCVRPKLSASLLVLLAFDRQDFSGKMSDNIRPVLISLTWTGPRLTAPNAPVDARPGTHLADPWWRPLWIPEHVTYYNKNAKGVEVISIFSPKDLRARIHFLREWDWWQRHYRQLETNNFSAAWITARKDEKGGRGETEKGT